ncbi:hypothetical protein LCGC14_2573560, partial [marine sediment metagenome]
MMASLSRDPGGRKRILFKCANGKRRAVRLGKLSVKAANAVLVRVEALEAAGLSGTSWDTETAAWVGARDEVIYRKLAAVGLVPPREPEPKAESVMLGGFLDQYMEGRTDIKPSTRTNLNQARRNLVRFFGAEKRLADISPGDADEFRRDLMTRLAENTGRRCCGRAKQFFRAAVRKRLITESPFADMKDCSVRANPSRLYFISREEAQAVLDACPDAQWRLLFALARFGGLRVPSEPLALRWTDVDWDRGRITIHSAKTEHHEGGESRQIPIFSELRPHLEAVWEQAEPGTEWVITRYRSANSNLRTQLLRIIERAGLKPWGKPFQNFRSTRETELAEKVPVHVVCKWLGNSQAVANRHYLQVTDEHFREASEGGAE